jgi:hypothetical protein
MALAIPALPFGVRDCKVYPIDATGTVGTGVDLPAIQTLAFSETEDSTELRGDDTVVATHGSGATGTWSLEAGGISLEAYVVMVGGTLTTTGATPNIKKTVSKLTTQSRPYFKVEGQAISDSGGDVHIIIFKCKADGDVGGEFADNAFYVTSLSGKSIGDATNKLYEIDNNETAVAPT